MLGRQVNFQRARSLRWAGDMVGAHKAILDEVERHGDLTQMNYFQQNALAEAAGLTVEQLQKQSQTRKMLNAMQDGTLEQQRAYNDYMTAQNALQSGNTKSLAEQGMEMVKQQRMQSQMNQLKNQFSAMMVEIGSTLVPMVSAGFKIMLPVLKLVGAGLKLIMIGLQPIVVVASAVAKAIGWVVDGISKLIAELTFGGGWLGGNYFKSIKYKNYANIYFWNTLES